MSQSFTDWGELESIKRWPCPWSVILPQYLGTVAFSVSRHASLPVSLLGLISSHGTRDAFMHPEWQRGLEVALSFAKASRATPIFGAGTPYADRLRHACQRFGVAHAEFVERETAAYATPSSDSAMPVQVHLFDHPSRSDIAAFGQVRFEDAATVLLTHALFVLHARPGGKLQRLLQARLSRPEIQPGSTYLAVGSRRTSSEQKLIQGFSKSGGVLWLSDPEGEDEGRRVDRVTDWGCRRRIVPSTRAPIVPFPPALLGGDYLIHCTRRRSGAWPDQSQSQFYDEAIRLTWEPTSRPIEALHRILMHQRLVATQRLRRASTPTVCFSGRTLQELLRMRAFQSHLARWDWEPYGIAIRRDRLEQQGARPVVYLKPSVLKQLSDTEVVYAQVASEKPGDRDWRVEAEWRVAGDVRLTSIAFDEAFVFVPNRGDAELLAPISRWPIAIVGELEAT